MEKISLPASNAFCPQCLFLYGTYKEGNIPNYGLFCWATYCWDDKFKFVACIGEDKLTRDRIRATGIFSASVVTKSLLPFADFSGNNSGYEVDKSKIIESINGAVLNVPVPKDSVWSFELVVDKTLRLDEEGKSEIYVCSIKNVLADERLADETISFEERLRMAEPVITMSARYFSVDKSPIGSWGNWKKL
ncbi:MAG: flavin reductase family protein [Oscillospiraceae bacterium]|nr:flavin reductase family protein [Oscillospiraceae bacterium]